MSGCTNPLEISMENVFWHFPNHFFCSRNTLVLTDIFFGRGKGEKFPCFQCGKWKICKLIEGKNQEKVQNPKGNAFSFLFQAALSLWLCVGAVERKLSLQMGSLWLWGCCCQGEGGTGTVSPGVAVGPGPGQLLPLAPTPFLQLVLPGGSLLLLPGMLWAGWGQGPTTLGGTAGTWRVKGCSHIPVQSQSQIPADLASQGNLSPPWVFAFKGSILDFTRIPSLSVLGHRAHCRGTGTALGVRVRAFPEGLRSDSCLIPKDGVAGQESV